MNALIQDVKIKQSAKLSEFLDCKDDNGETALMYAARWGLTDVVGLLLGEKANKSIQNSSEKTALEIAEDALKKLETDKTIDQATKEQRKKAFEGTIKHLQ